MNAVNRHTLWLPVVNVGMKEADAPLASCQVK
jgi:hypothetical protein